jgi:hypothetical protein
VNKRTKKLNGLNAWTSSPLPAMPSCAIIGRGKPPGCTTIAGTRTPMPLHCADSALSGAIIRGALNAPSWRCRQESKHEQRCLYWI